MPTIDGVGIIETDLPTANGLLHVVESVILPAQKSTLEILKEDRRMQKLVTLLVASGLDLALADSTKYTIFAPLDEAWDAEEVKSLVADPTGANRERIFAILARHVITGKHVSANPVPYEKLQTIHGAPIYLTVDNGRTRIQGIEILEADTEAFNGLVNVIGKVIGDPMELPENDLTKLDGIKFAQATLRDGSKLYDAGQYQASFRLYARRGYEFVDKYGRFLPKNGSEKLLAIVALSADPVVEFADNAWNSRNAFRAALRDLEVQQEAVEDLLQLSDDEASNFGR